MLGQGYGMNNLLKEGHKHFSGLEEAVLKNINACKEISTLTKTSLGPNGMKKMIINHLEKIFITSDAATIMRELEVQHPAAKMVVMASKMQDEECGDATNLVITFAGELLSQAEQLLKMGLHPSQIISGYELAKESAIKYLQEFKSKNVQDIRNFEEIRMPIKSAIASKIIGFEDFLSELVANACLKTLPDDAKAFEPEYIRVCKVLGGSLFDSQLVQGMVVARNSENSITRVNKPKIACFSTSLDPQQSETKANVLIKNSKQLLDYTKGEEDKAEGFIKSLVEQNVNLVVVGGTISDIVHHYLEKYKIMCVKLTSKFELKRLCKAVRANPIASFTCPTADECGTCDEVYVTEISSQRVTIFKKDSVDCKLSTIVLRGNTHNLLDDVERAIDDGINCYRQLIKDNRLLPGGGSIEMLLANKIQQEGESLKDLNQYAYKSYGLSFELIPRILAENAGINGNTAMDQMKVNNKNSEEPFGVSVEKRAIIPVKDIGIYDHLMTKKWAIQLASDVAVTILRIDQIVISKPAGGPKPQQNKSWDED